MRYFIYNTEPSIAKNEVKVELLLSLFLLFYAKNLWDTYNFLKDYPIKYMKAS